MVTHEKNSELPVLAYGFDTFFKIRDLEPCFAGASLQRKKTQLVAEYAPDRQAVAFDFGAVVFVNVEAEERTRVLGAILQRLARKEPHPPLEEDFLLEMAPGAPDRGEVRFDRIRVSSLTPPVVEVVTLLLAQSVAIDYYEEDLGEIIAELEKRTEVMMDTGRVNGSRKEFVRFVAQAVATKNQIVGKLAFLDKPAVTWEAEALDNLYRDFRAMLELDERFRALEYKLRTVYESLDTLMNITQTRRSLFLETVIVVLIAVEIVLALLRIT